MLARAPKRKRGPARHDADVAPAQWKRPVCRCPRASPSEDWLRTARLTRLLSWLSLVWLGIERAVAIVAGVMAGSIVLIAFGLDSAIEGVASPVTIWRFSGSRPLSERAERRTQALVGPVLHPLVVRSREAHVGRTGTADLAAV
jgi:hypothetical protein